VVSFNQNRVWKKCTFLYVSLLGWTSRKNGLMMPFRTKQEGNMLPLVMFVVGAALVAVAAIKGGLIPGIIVALLVAILYAVLPLPGLLLAILAVLGSIAYERSRRHSY
jgi:hypothetical protein